MNFLQAKEILLQLNPDLNDNPGVYFFIRTDEYGIKHAYIGQSIHILTRLYEHLNGFSSHIDLSIRKYGLFKPDNTTGWRVGFLNLPVNQLDNAEKHYIKLYANKGYQLKNSSLGGSGANKSSGSLSETPRRGYREGVFQGRRQLAKELLGIYNKHLVISVKPEKEGNKISEKQLDKFMNLLSGLSSEKQSDSYYSHSSDTT